MDGNSPHLSELITDIDAGKKYWGQGNTEPIIICENIPLYADNCCIIGKNKETIKFSFNGIEYIKFKAQDLINTIHQYKDKMNVVVVGTANINTWGGFNRPQIFIKEIDIRERTEFDF